MRRTVRAYLPNLETTRFLRNNSNLRTRNWYCLFADKWRVVLGDPLSPNLHTEGNFLVRFSRRKSIGFPKLYRLTSSFFALRKYFDVQIWRQCVMPGVPIVGCTGRISHTNLKIRMVISGIATSKNHIELLVPGQIWDQICDHRKILV